MVGRWQAAKHVKPRLRLDAVNPYTSAEDIFMGWRPSSYIQIRKRMSNGIPKPGYGAKEILP
jgi:hypothetical protein